MLKLKDVTSTSQDIVTVIQSNINSAGTIKVYSYKDTLIIFTDNKKVKHASLSNEKRDVQMSEISYVTKKIMNTTIDKVKIILTKTGVVHLHLDVTTI
jgi:hypothetical protein